MELVSYLVSSYLSVRPRLPSHRILGGIRLGQNVTGSYNKTYPVNLISMCSLKCNV
jgi:hypothetical protein